MNSRLPKVNSLLREELGEIFLRELDIPKNILVTITDVRTCADMSLAKVFISIMPRSEQGIFEMLTKNIFSIQQRLNKKLNMRPVPRIKFILDKEMSREARIEELLDKVKNKKAG